jgi:hypothetical protein
MFLLYHSKGCNICELVLHECYVNDLYTTTCSGMLGHHIGLRLFAWWKKNGERRLQKPGSGSAEIRSENLKPAAVRTDPLYSCQVL